MTEKKNTRGVGNRPGPSRKKTTAKPRDSLGDALLDLASDFHCRAIETGGNDDLALAHVLDAAIVVSRRALDDNETKGLLIAVRKYLRTKEPSERSGPPPPLLARSGADRARAVRRLLATANKAAEDLRKRPDWTDACASALVAVAHSLGLYRKRSDLTLASEKLSTRLKKRIALMDRFDGEAVARWTLMATGGGTVSSQKASSIVSDSLRGSDSVTESEGTKKGSSKKRVV